MVLLLSAEMYTTDMSLLVAIWGCRLSPWVKSDAQASLKSAAVLAMLKSHRSAMVSA
jgi:hypothetical protein